MAGEDDLDLLAGEHVLGTLDATDRQAVELRMLDSPELARRVAAWERRLAPLSEDLPRLAPPPRLWWRLRRTVAARGGGGGGRGGERAAPGPRWWDRLDLWRGCAAAATAAAAALALLLVAPAEPRQLVAVMSDPAGRPLWVVRAGGAGSPLLARPIDGAGSARQVPQLWLARGDMPPLSLGLLERGAGGRQALTPPAAARLAAGATMAISLEPPGGSPTGRPTGPVVSHGVLIAEPL